MVVAAIERTATIVGEMRRHWLSSVLMTSIAVHGLPRWSLAVPPLALLVLAVAWGRDLGPVLL